MSFEGFARYWIETHGPIAAKLPGLNRLVTNLVRPELQRSETPWDGLSFAWFESADAVRSVASTPEFRAMLDDEENFVDTSNRSPMFITPHSPTGEAPMSTKGLSDTIKTVVPIWRKNGMELETQYPLAQHACGVDLQSSEFTHVRTEHSPNRYAAPGAILRCAG